ncbi:MAG: hypothetical protein HY901_21785 [Deltaproteobacteria bacterium]|nr:hypothetical protein [Deltaproteobacteria bacterium]
MDATTELEEDASSASDSSTAEGPDATTDQDAATPEPGLDATTPEPGLDAAIAEPGMDAMTSPGQDATTPPGMDATTLPGMDAATPPGMDATTLPGMDAATPPGMDASVPVTQRSLGMLKAHVMEDLHSRGCDVWSPYSMACRWASFEFCRAQGFAGGFGASELVSSGATVTCLGEPIAEYREVPYSGLCTMSNPNSLFCDSVARRGCQTQGFESSVGVIGFNGSVVATMCLKSSALVEELGGVPESELFNAFSGSCSVSALVDGNSCQPNVKRLCNARGFDTGFEVLEFDSNSHTAIVVCARRSSYDQSFAQQDERGFVEIGGPGFKRPARHGVNLVGGATFADPITYIDGIFNDQGTPLLVKRMAPQTSFRAASTFGYSRDSCFYLNQGDIWQHDENDDGEVTCTYSETVDSSVTDFRDRGLLLRPGEALLFQGTADWSGSSGQYTWAEVTGAPVTGSDAPGRRVRFPKWDTGYVIPGGGRVSIPAGCTGGCPPTPTTVPAGKPLENSNWWYAAPEATHIRGISIFLSSGTAPGTQGAEACLRVVQQGGQDIRTPWCFSLSGDHFSPASYDQAFGAQQSGSNFVALDVDVPQGALIGFDFALVSPGGGGMDLAGYVWLDAH